MSALPIRSRENISYYVPEDEPSPSKSGLRQGGVQRLRIGARELRLFRKAKPTRIVDRRKNEIVWSSIMADSIRGSRNMDRRDAGPTEASAQGGNGESGTHHNGANGHYESALRDGVRDIDPIETREWLDALDAVLQS